MSSTSTSTPIPLFTEPVSLDLSQSSTSTLSSGEFVEETGHAEIVPEPEHDMSRTMKLGIPNEFKWEGHEMTEQDLNELDAD